MNILHPLARASHGTVHKLPKVVGLLEEIKELSSSMDMLNYGSRKSELESKASLAMEHLDLAVEELMEYVFKQDHVCTHCKHKPKERKDDKKDPAVGRAKRSKRMRSSSGRDKVSKGDRDSGD